MFLAQYLRNIFQVYQLLLFIWVILSWIPGVPRNHPAREFLERIIEPTLRPFRNLVPLGGIDISPILAIFVYQIVINVLIQLLVGSGL
jgi:YggT family protein